ncbi:hypothetical protein ACQV2T_06640 [Facklamia sp. P13069]|uniref:hypothetical protein n=1 Tax=Facklamia sp. P13069 TaxID=3421954 RepID=UPI003D16BE88
MKESKFQEEVISYLKSIDAYIIKYWGGGVFTKEGVPDLLVCINGEFHGIELKTDVGTESKLQAYHMDQINQSGGKGYILRPTKYKKLKYGNEFDYYQLEFEEWKEWLKNGSRF